MARRPGGWRYDDPAQGRTPVVNNADVSSRALGGARFKKLPPESNERDPFFLVG